MWIIIIGGGDDMDKLNKTCEFLNECGIAAEYRTERVEPYVNVGNVKRIKERMQFWIPNNTDEVYMFVGKDMGKWYEQSSKSVYLNSKYRYSDKENRVEFPNMDLAFKFIKEVSEL